MFLQYGFRHVFFLQISLLYLAPEVSRKSVSCVLEGLLNKKITFINIDLLADLLSEGVTKSMDLSIKLISSLCAQGVISQISLAKVGDIYVA